MCNGWYVPHEGHSMLQACHRIFVLYLVLKFTWSLQSSILMSSVFFSLPQLSFSLYPFLFVKSFRLVVSWHSVNSLRIDRMVHSGLSGNNPVQRFFQVHLSDLCCIRKAEINGGIDPSYRRDVVLPDLHFASCYEKTAPFLVVDDKHVACHKSFLTSRF